MDKKSKILLIVVVLTLITSLGLTFYRSVFLGDFPKIEKEELPGENMQEIEE
jgi:hypothetical protein